MPQISRIWVAAAALLVAGCAEVEDTDPVVEPVETRQQDVTVVPTFTITGLNQLPDQLYLTELGFTVSEIRLEPLTSRDGQVAYSVVKPRTFHFKVADGDLVQSGEPIELPHAGRYLVSLRLEPTSEPELTPLSSFELSGFVAQSSMRVDPRASGDGRGDRPRPNPFDGGGQVEPPDDGTIQDSPETPESWTPFHYHSERAVFFPLNEVDLSAGEQHLDFSFDVQKWAVEIVDPISRAVETDESVRGEQEGVDISRHLDSSGQGAEAFIQGGSAQATPRGRIGG